MHQRHFDRVLLAGSVLLVFLMLGPALSVPLHIPLGYNEGWNAVFAGRAVMPGTPPLYPRPLDPGDGGFVFNNYPPLSFYIVGVLGRFVFGDMIVAGRIVSLFSMIVVSGLIVQCVRHLGGTLRSGVAAGLLMLLIVCAFYRGYVAMDDPQWLAEVFSIGGLTVLLHHRGTARIIYGDLAIAKLACAALLMLAGGLVKHNVVALPLAVTVWLLMLNRRAAIAWVGLAAAGLCVALLVVACVHGRAAFIDILQHRRIYRASLMKNSFFRLIPIMPMAAIEALLLRAIRQPTSTGEAPGEALRERRAAFALVGLFGVIATVTGVLQRYGEGVYYNAHFETLVAVSLGFGLALGEAFRRVQQSGMIRASPALLTGIAALPMIAAAPWYFPAAWHDITDRALRVQAWQPMIARIAAADGPAGCMSMSLCWWAGKPSAVDVFNLTERAEAGGDIAGFTAAIKAHRLAIFQDDPASFTHRDGIRRVGYDPVMQPFVAAGYTLVARGPENTVLLAPAGTAPQPVAGGR